PAPSSFPTRRSSDLPTSSDSSRPSIWRPRNGARATAHRIEIRSRNYRGVSPRENLFEEGAGQHPCSFFCAKCPKTSHKILAGERSEEHTSELQSREN